MRHGDAEKNIGISDRARTLTKKGFYDLEKLSLSIKKKKIRFEHVWVSPYQRTLDTCRKLEKCGVISSKISVLPELKPNAYDANLTHDIRYLYESECFDNLIIISHLPLVHYLCFDLTKESARFGTSSMAVINYCRQIKKFKLHEVITPTI